MMAKIELFNNPVESKYVEWVFKGVPIRIDGRGKLLAVKTNENKVVVVDMAKDWGADNAFIYSANGSLSTRIMNPLKKEGYICFDDVYFIKGRVALISGSRSGRQACEIDEEGRVIDIHEVR